MKDTAIFWPMIALVALTVAVQVRMYLSRVAEIRAKQLRLGVFATRREAGAALQDTTAADNFNNLFELPVLFYAVCIALFVTGAVTALQLALAWAFVVTRVVHSVIHLTYNQVRHRFLAFFAGTLCVVAMWALFAVHLI